MYKSKDEARATVKGKGELEDRREVGDEQVLLTRAENMVLVMNTPKGTLEALRDFLD